MYLEIKKDKKRFDVKYFLHGDIKQEYLKKLNEEGFSSYHNARETILSFGYKEKIKRKITTLQDTY